MAVLYTCALIMIYVTPEHVSHVIVNYYSMLRFMNLNCIAVTSVGDQVMH